MPALNPWYACVSEGFGKSFFEVQRFPLVKRIQLLDKMVGATGSPLLRAEHRA
jgi:hypothetical protein